MKSDLHIHTNFSDGVFTPEKLVDTAMEIGLDVIALTDHDNVLSHQVAYDYLKYLKKTGCNQDLIIVPGVEINTIYKNYEIHILGYFMDTKNNDFQSMMKAQQEARIVQAKEILALLHKKEGIRVGFDKLKSLVAPGGSIGRPHIAKAIMMMNGTNSVTEAYEKYIHDGSGVYVQRKTVTPHDAVEIIYHAGGIPVIAHPYDIDIAEQVIEELMQYGLMGIEAYHRKHSPAMVEYYFMLAEKLGLIVTGGSDFHAPNPNNGNITLGKNFVPEWVYDKMLEAKKRLDISRN